MFFLPRSLKRGQVSSGCTALNYLLSGSHPPYAFYRGGVLEHHFVDVNEMVL
jgi:hypothetical protein